MLKLIMHKFKVGNAKKAEEISLFQKEISHKDLLIVNKKMDKTGLTSEECVRLRNLSRAANISIKVIKNKLAQIVLSTKIDKSQLEGLSTECMFLISDDSATMMKFINTLPKDFAKKLSANMLLAHSDKGYVMYNNPKFLQTLAKAGSKARVMSNCLAILTSPIAKLLALLNKIHSTT